MILALAFAALWFARPGFQEPTKDAPAAPADADQDQFRLGTLRRDPSSLPRAPADRWKDFEKDPSKPPTVPAAMRDAVVALRERDLPRALMQLYDALDAEPDYPPALYEMGVVYFRLQRYGDAAAVLERFVAHVPERVGDTRVLGHCYYSLGDYAKAEKHYERVLAASPDAIEALRGLALTRMRLGDAKKCLELLDRVLALDPRHAEAWTWRAQVLYDQERSEDALAAAERARDLVPWQPRPWFLLGRILGDLGRDEDAAKAEARCRELSLADQEIRSLDNRLEYQPDDAALLVRLVELRRTTGNVPGARQALARLVKTKPADIELRILALDVLEGMGDVEGAKLAARAIEQQGPSERKAWERLERFYGRIKDSAGEARAAAKVRALERK